MEESKIILEYVKALLWPTILLVFVLVFRAEIRNIIAKISELSIGGKNGLSLKIKVEKELLKPVSTGIDQGDKKESVSILDLPDDDFLFLEKISNNTNFYVSSDKEKLRYVSLSNQGYFSKVSGDEFKPTDKGDKVLNAFKNL